MHKEDRRNYHVRRTNNYIRKDEEPIKKETNNQFPLLSNDHTVVKKMMSIYKSYRSKIYLH